MRVLIFGASGMLGHKLYQQLRPEFEVFGTIRSGFEEIEKFGFFERPSILENVNAENLSSVREAVETVRPDCVINAIGLIKHLPEANNVIGALSINSIFPHQLAGLSTEFGFRLITLSTDCVFDGKKGNYSEDDRPDARDLYGLSKLLGEVTGGPNLLTIRTSIIGRELGTRHSLVEWFLSQRGQKIKGYVNAIYSGFPTIVLVGIIADIIAHHPGLCGLAHISSEPVNKFDLLSLINQQYQPRVEIEPFQEYVIDRSLDSTRFRTITSFKPASWENMIEQMATDPTPYDAWHVK